MVPAATRPHWPQPPFPRCCVTITRPRALPPRRVPISGFICCLLLHGGIFNLLITLRAEVVLGTHSRNVWKSAASGAAGTRPVPSHVSPPRPALGPPSCPAWRGTSSRTSTSWHRAAHGLAGLHHTHIMAPHTQAARPHGGGSGPGGFTCPRACPGCVGSPRAGTKGQLHGRGRGGVPGTQWQRKASG